MGDAHRVAVAARAFYRCEYCQLHADDDAFSFHVEHIVALKHGGTQALDNLAFACQHCNLHKGPNLSGIDPETGEVTTLFHPRQHTWAEHFSTGSFRIVGLTPAGRTTVHVLAMNDADRVKLRTMLAPSHR
jgi:HNH endonuclease